MTSLVFFCFCIALAIYFVSCMRLYGHVSVSFVLFVFISNKYIFFLVLLHQLLKNSFCSTYFVQPPYLMVLYYKFSISIKGMLSVPVFCPISLTKFNENVFSSEKYAISARNTPFLCNKFQFTSANRLNRLHTTKTSN